MTKIDDRRMEGARVHRGQDEASQAASVEMGDADQVATLKYDAGHLRQLVKVTDR